MLKNYFNPDKVLVHGNKIEEILEGNIPIPVAVEIDPANSCNAKCHWCLFDNTRQGGEMMTKDDMYALVNELTLSSVKSVTFTGGGEPLVNPATIKVIEYFGKLIDMGLVTNAIALNNKTCKILANKVRYVRVSVDAASIGIYKKMKGVNKFSYVIKMLKQLVKERDKTKKDFQVGVAFVVHKDNWHEIFKFTKLMKKIGVDYIAIRPVIGWSLGQFPKKDYDTVLKEVEMSERLQTDDFRVFANIRRMDEVACNKKNFTKCLSTPLIGIVGADMNIYICCQMRLNKKWSIGRIDYKDNKHFFDLWGDVKHKKIIDSINVKKCVPCRNSRYNEIIESGFMEDYFHKNFI